MEFLRVPTACLPATAYSASAATGRKINRVLIIMPVTRSVQPTHKVQPGVKSLWVSRLILPVHRPEMTLCVLQQEVSAYPKPSPYSLTNLFLIFRSTLLYETRAPRGCQITGVNSQGSKSTVGQSDASVTSVESVLKLHGARLSARWITSKVG